MVAQLPLTTDCGPPPLALNRSLPNVLLIGDSISLAIADNCSIPRVLGYGWKVQRFLQEQAAVQHSGGWYAEGNAANTIKGVTCIRHWLGSARWDVVHLNFGLHDIDEAEYVGERQYTENLDRIYAAVQEALLPTGQFIWATTTPVPFPSEYRLRNNSAVQRYNHLAARLWSSKPSGAVVVNDLYSLITRRCGSTGALGSYAACSLQRQWTGKPGEWPKRNTTGGVHYNARGREYMAAAVASIVAQHLPASHSAMVTLTNVSRAVVGG